MLHHQGTVEHKPLTPLPSTGLKLADCVWHCFRQWGIMVMARSSGTNNKTKGLTNNQIKGVVQNIGWSDF